MVMAERRKIRQSTRTHGDSPFKKPLNSPSSLPKQVPKQVESLEAVLPYSLNDDQDLPTLVTPQSKDLSYTEYQSIAESGVLLSSLNRSRHRWLTDGIFERYWAKPSKKRASVDSQNPAKESMTRLGACSMIIEPHVFETTLYTVKEPQPNIPPPNPQPPPTSDMRFSSFSHVAIYPPASHSSSTMEPRLQKNGQQQSGSSQLTLPPFKEGFGQFAPRDPSHQGISPTSERIAASSGQYGTNSARREGVQIQDEKPNTDPVIQMLATRAASNHDLKTLMKVVASGNASQSQLRDFQNHIDELNSILQKQNDSSQSHHAKGKILPPISLYNEQQNLDQTFSNSTLTIGHMPNAATAHVPLKPISGAIKPEPLPQYFSHYTQPPKSKGVYTSYKSEIRAVVFDLGGSGDRFLFPRFSILEYLPGGTQVIVSFLVIRRGNTAVSKGYRDTTSYYQPVTMRLSSSHPRVLEPLARVIAPPDEVRKYMNSVFDRMSAAESVFLATRLPRPKDSTSAEDASSADPKSDYVRTIYSPPNSLMPLKT